MPAESLALWDEGLDDAERARRMVTSAKLIAGTQQEDYRRNRDIDHVRLYESDPSVTMYDFAGRFFSDGGAMPLSAPDDSINNKAKSAIDTLLAQVASTDQRARCLSRDGNYRQRRRARELQTFVDGLAYDLKLHAHRKRGAKDAAILQSGVGVLQFFNDNGRCAVQRILATELAVNPSDGLVDGQARTIYRNRPMARASVIKKFCGGDQKLIDLVNSQQLKGIVTSGAPSDDVRVYESWTLSTEEGADDGWHIVALDVEGGVMVCKPYKKTFHELVFFCWEERFTTVWGMSLMGQVRKLQRRINARSYRIDKAERLLAAGHIYVPREMNFDRAQITNEIGSVWTGNGPEPPKLVQYQAATKEMYDNNERDGQRIFENLGINQGAAQGASDRGLDASGAAMREETKKSDKRNADRQQRWEQNFIDCMRVALSVVRDIVTGQGEGKKKSGYKVAAPGKHGLTVKDWLEVAVDEKALVLEIKPASPIPTDPAGLVAFGKDMVAMQAWTPQQMAGYLQDLDSDSRVNRQLAPERRLEKMFEDLLYEPRAAAIPTEFTNLKLALELGVDYLAQGEEDGVPEKHLERVRRYLKRCKAIGDKQAAIAQQQVAPAAAAPPSPVAAA